MVDIKRLSHVTPKNLGCLTYGTVSTMTTVPASFEKVVKTIVDDLAREMNGF